jgi:signal peptidase I
VDIDFPLVLTWAVLISGAIWLFDALLLRPRRIRAAETLVAGGTPEMDVEQTLKESLPVEYARSFFPVLLLVLVLRSFLAEPYQIPSESMLPTLEVGDFILVNKYAYGIRLPVLGTKIFEVGKPRRGDVMVFVPPHDSRYFIKRVIGLPGDTIRYENKSLYVNNVRASYQFVGQFLESVPFARGQIAIREYLEDLGGRQHSTYRYDFPEGPREWVVPEGGYFMMGDNRGKSEDSRAWKTAAGPTPFVPEANIVGKAVAIWVHKDPGWHWPTFARNQWFD